MYSIVLYLIFKSENFYGQLSMVTPFNHLKLESFLKSIKLHNFEV